LRYLIFFADDQGRIVYDDGAIEALLDRSKEGIQEKEGGMDEYLSSFKVNEFTIKKLLVRIVTSDIWKDIRYCYHSFCLITNGNG